MPQRARRVDSLNIAEAKRQFSDLIGRVAYGGATVIITRRGRPMAKLVPAETSSANLAEVAGWLEDDDPFFAAIDAAIAARANHPARALRAVARKPRRKA